jgi:hypothetical protein
MTFQGGNFGEEAHDQAKQPPQDPQTPPFGQDFTPPAYAEQPPAQQPNAPHYPPQPGPVPPWAQTPTEYPAPSQQPPSGYGQPGYAQPRPYGVPSYPPPPPQYGPSYPPPGYSGGGYGGPPAYPGPYDPYQLYRDRSQETNGLAIASLITSIVGGLLGIPLSFAMIGILFPIIGAVLGVAALSQIKRTGQQGRGLAIAGIAVGATAAVLLVLLVILVVAASRSPSFT